MALRWFDLRIVVLIFSAVVNAARNQKDCTAPDIPNGFFISERRTFSHDTELYYGCDPEFIPVEGTWWGTVTCQFGNWSSSPQCIRDSACFEPEVPNATYDSFKYVENNGGIKIKCKPGYEDRRARARAICQGGKWTGLPECEKTNDRWCGPPPKVSNAVIINQVPKDIYAEGISVEYMCRSGFELGTNSNTATCSYGQWLSPPLCRPKPTIKPVPQVPAVNPRSVSDKSEPMYRKIDECGSPPAVQNAEYFEDEARRFVKYRCNYYYDIKGSSIVRCANRQWTQAPTCEDDYCLLDTSRVKALKNIGNVFLKSSTQRKLSCNSWKKTAILKCENNQLILSDCCYGFIHDLEYCGEWEIQPPR